MRSGLAIVLLAAALATADAQQPTSPSDQEEERSPREIGLIERAERRLAQLDITVLGDEAQLRDLRAEDFEIRINLRRVTDFELDRLCEIVGSVSDDTGDSVLAPSESVPVTAPLASYLFYFDQPHLTLGGRQRGLDVAREMITRLLGEHDRAMIVSNAGRLKVHQRFTSDREQLLAALERLEHDREQWDAWAEQEKTRIDEVVRELNDDQDVQRAIAKARLFQKEERWRTEQSLRRLEISLGPLIDLESPKALVYFADTLRSNPGEHYLSFFGYSLQQSEPGLTPISSDGLTASLSFDRVVNEASAHGIRIYSVEARGMADQSDLSGLNPKAYDKVKGVSSNSRVRLVDAQETLGDMAAETGGAVFLHGVRAAKIAERIREDSGCLYLASFDPSSFREDVPLRVSVNIDRPGVRVRVRGRMVFPSESTRRTGRLLRAFSTADEIEDPLSVRAGMVPISFANGVYTVLLQVSVPGTPLPGATWDLGASLVAERKVRNETSGRIQVNEPGVPVVLERELRIKPGSYEVVCVAHETNTGLITSDEIGMTWPAPGEARAVLTPIALVQPVSGAYLRDGQTRLQGSLARGVAEAVRPDRPTALIGLVCRSRRQKGPLSIERSLNGRSEQSFDPLTLDLEDDRCAQVRDLLPADSLTRGFYRYDIRIVEDGQTLQQRSREFYVMPTDRAAKSVAKP